MEYDLSGLSAFLDDRDADGYLLDDGAGNADQRYLSGHDAEDPFLTLYTPETTRLLFWGSDYFSATDRSRADEVYRAADYGYHGYGSLDERHRVTGEFVADHGVETVVVPERFPLGTAEALAAAGIAVQRDGSDVLTQLRSRKAPDEVAALRDAVAATEAAYAAVEETLASASVVDGHLAVDGDALTVAALSREITATLLDRNYLLVDPLVACGSDTAEPHGRSTGPIPAGEPIQLDLIPRDVTTGYYADVSRAFVRGEPDGRLREWYDLVDEALDRAEAVVGPDVTGPEVNDVLCSFFEERGFATPRTDDSIERGVLHYMGHGVGLDVHELPLCTPDGGDLEPGNVITVEPGLYDPDLGGVRLEDVLLVTEDGCENLTSYPRTFQV